MATRFSRERSTSPTLHRESTLYDYDAARDATHSHLKDSNTITPYVARRGRLSQVWINRWTVLLFLVLVRLLLAIADYRDTVGDAEREALSACTSVESMGSTLASMPHYMSRGVNELTANGVEKAINGLISMLSMSITAVEALVVFVIHMLTQTYLCLITFAITGSLHVALQLIEDATNFLNESIGSIEGDIRTSVSNFEDTLNKFTGALNDVPSVFGGGQGAIPTLNLDDQLTALNNLRLPSDIDQSIQDLNSSIPTFTQVNDFVDSVIKFPFEQLKQLVNGSVGNYTFDHTLLPVPEKEQLTFCSENNKITEFFDGLIKLGILGRKIAIAVLVILAVLVCIPMAYREIRRWRLMEERAQLIGRNTYDPLDVVYIASRPYTATAGLTLADRFSSSRHQYLARWVVAYATTEPALFVLSLAIAGLFSCLCQYILLKAVEKAVPDLAQEVGAFAGKVTNALDNASAEWANGTNSAILDINGKINDDMFSWVNISTTAMNDTLNTFVDETMNVLNTTFGGTVLYDPIIEVFNCLIGLKIAGIERGLTWVSDHAHVDFPLLPNDTFSISGLAAQSNDPNATTFLADPSSGTEDRVTAAVSRLVDRMADHIRTETIISVCVLIVWLIILLLGVGRALMLAFGPKQKHISGPFDSDVYDRAATVGAAAYPDKSAQVYAEPLPRPPDPPVSAHHQQARDVKTVDKLGQEVDPFADPVAPSTAAGRKGVPSFAFFRSPPPSGDESRNYNVDYDGPAATKTTTTNLPANAANQYKGAAYTLNPKPFPVFPSSSHSKATVAAVPSAVTMRETTSRSPSPDDDDGTAAAVERENQRLGYAGARNVVTQRPGHARKSSYAEMGGATPNINSHRSPANKGPDADVTFQRMGH